MFRVSPALRSPSSSLPGQIYPFGFQWSRADSGGSVVMGWRAGLGLPAMPRIDHKWDEASVSLLLPRGFDRRRLSRMGHCCKPLS